MGIPQDTLIRLVRYMIGSLATHSQRDIVLFIKNIVCWHQGKLIEYNALGKAKQDKLRDAVASGNIQAIKEAHQSLDDYLFKGLDEIFLYCFEQASEYFQDYRKTAHTPRFCVKMFGRIPGKIEQHIITMMHTSKTLDSCTSSSVERDHNTAFIDTANTGKTYLCNDIPSAAQNGEYVNPRLIPERVNSYRKPWFPRVNSFRGKKDDAWRQCWKGYSEGSPVPEDCYKSTLVIPLTLVGHAVKRTISDEFWIFFRDNLDDGKTIDELRRTIVGYFCMDTPELNFFNHQMDEDIGWLIADILSLYWFSGCCYTSFSNIYKNAEKLLKPNPE